MTRRQAGRESAIKSVIVEALRAYFRLRAAGRESGAVSPSGGGVWGLMRSLALEGPQTVPQLARSRPVARQHIQRLADELEADGLVHFIDNPAHKRSKLVQLTPSGEKEFARLDRALEKYAERISNGISEKDARTAAKVLNRLSENVAKELGLL